jgi:hypothetical protein
VLVGGVECEGHRLVSDEKACGGLDERACCSVCGRKTRAGFV